MLQRLTEVAPLSLWALVVGSTLLFVCGFVTYGHARLARRAYGARFHGLGARGLLESMVRWTGALFGAALLLWGVALDWPGELQVALGGTAALCLALEAFARTR